MRSDWRKSLTKIIFIGLVSIVIIFRKSVINKPNIVDKSRWKGYPSVKKSLTILGTEKSVSLDIEKMMKYTSLFPVNKTYNFSVHQLDATRSNRIPLDRKIIDTRPLQCKRTVYHNVPKKAVVSIVIPFHNELWSMLLRTIHSVINRTPGNLLKEIIMINDCSTYSELYEPLERYLKRFRKVRIFRNDIREGLIRARLKGAKMASGEYLVFIDAHIEVGYNWLLPLLDALISNKTTVAIPHVDSIDPYTIQYTKWDGEYHGGFSWNLDYVWKKPVKQHNDSSTLLIPTPTTIGCLIAIHRDYFFRMGGFDEGMFIWGGENLELSFRIWMCHGSVHIVPCSRIGHIFRAFLPYKFPIKYGGAHVIQMNYQRLAEVWMDEYKLIYYASSQTKSILPFNHYGLRSLRNRMNIRTKLKCHNFKWYLQNVIPEMVVPPLNAVYHGQLLNVYSGKCISFDIQNHKPHIVLKDCREYDASSVFTLNNSSYIQSSMNHHLCMSVTSKNVINLVKCNKGSYDTFVHQKWDFIPGLKTVLEKIEGVTKDQIVGQLRIRKSSDTLYCLTENGLNVNQLLNVSKCNVMAVKQYWIFTYKFRENVLKSIRNSG